MRELEFELGYLVVLQGYLRVKEQREKKVELRCWLMIEGGGKRTLLEASGYA